MTLDDMKKKYGQPNVTISSLREKYGLANNRSNKPITLASLDLGSSGRDEIQAAAKKKAAMQKYIAGQSSFINSLNASLDSKGLLHPKNTVTGYKSGTEINASYGRSFTQTPVSKSTGTEKRDYLNAKRENTQLASAAARAGIQNTSLYQERATAAEKKLSAAEAVYEAKKKADDEAIRNTDLNSRAAKIRELENAARSAPDFAEGYTKGKVNNAKMFADISKGEQGNYYYAGMQSKKNARINYMTASEKNIYAYWLDKDPDTAEEYYDALSTAINYRYQTDENAQTKRISEQAPALGAGINVISSFASPLGLAGTAVHNIGDAIRGEETPIDPNSAMFTGAHGMEQSAEGIKENTETAFGDFLVDTGLSMVQFASKIPLGALALPMMASGAGGQTALEVTQRGGTAKQALGMGLLSAAAEYFTEKMSFDSLLSIYKNGGRGFKNAFQAAASNVLKQSRTEFTEELTSEILNNISDELIMGDNSQMQNYIDYLLEQGYSEEEALRKAATQFWVINPLVAGAGGALSGGMIGTFGSVAGNIRQGKFDAQSGAEMRNVWGRDFDAALDEIIATGQEYSDATGAGYYSDKAKATIDSGKELTDKQTGRLYRNVVDTQAQEAEAYFNGEMPRDPMRRDAEGYLTLPMPWQVSEYQIQKQQYQYAQKLAQNLNQFGVKNVVVENMPEGESGRWENGTVYVSSKLDTARAVNTKVAHEISHAAKEGDAAFTTDIIAAMSETGRDIDTAIQKKLTTYQNYWKEKGKSAQWINNTVTEEYAADEVAADYIGELMQNDNELASLSKKPTLIRRILNAIDRLVTGKSPRERLQYNALANKLRSVAGVEQTAESGTESSVRYSINPEFTSEIDNWDGKTDKTFHVGTTSKALQSIGVRDKNIIWHSAKIGKILKKHENMSIDTIKQVPYILENPIIVVTSKYADSRVLLFADITDIQGAPVTAVLELAPTSKGGQVVDLNVIISAYGKNKDPNEFVRNSSVLFLDKDRKRTNTWLQGLGLQLPSDTTTYGSIGKVSYFDDYVKVEGVPYEQLTHNNGDYVYSFQAQKRNLSTLRTFRAGGHQAENDSVDTQVSNNSIRNDTGKINNNFSGPRMSSEDESGEARYAVEAQSIKEQIIEHKDELNQMSPVSYVQSKGWKGKTDRNYLAELSEKFNAIGFKVERQNFGTIILDKKRINKGLNYVETSAEAAAMLAVPDVLKKGSEITDRANHKERDYPTFTFAAPVVLNGQRGNMAVVVKKITEKQGLGRNMYNAHRILMPDGTLFVLPETADAEPTTGVGASKNEAAEPPINSASDNSIRGDEEKINTDFSDPRMSLEDESGTEDDLQIGAPRVGSEEYLRQQQEALDEYWELVQHTADAEASPGMTVTSPEDKVIAEYLKPEMSTGEKIKESWYHVKRQWVDSGEAVDRIGKALGDKYLYAYYNMARASTNAGTSMIIDGQADIYGKKTGKSLNDIFKPIREKGDEYYKRFELYMWHLHNVDRMSRRSEVDVIAAREAFAKYQRKHTELYGLTEKQIELFSKGESAWADSAKEYIQLRDTLQKAQYTQNKPVFDYNVTADESHAEVDKLLRENPEFAELRDEVYRYIDNLMKYRVDSGLITQDELVRLKGIYPHYVPTYRAINKDVQQKKRSSVQVGKTVGRAQGGTESLLPLHQALARQTMNVVRESAKNRFGMRLLNSEKLDKIKGHVYEATEYESDFNADTFDDIQNDGLKKTNTFIVRNNGTMWEMNISPALYEAVKTLSPDQDISYAIDKWARAANTLFKELVTGYNPIFVARNFLRDAQDAGFYSEHLRKTAAAYPLAWKEITTNGKYWQMYKALGGTYTTIFDYYTGSEKKEGKLKQYTLGKIEILNQWVEQAPRLAEFMATVKSGDGSYENLMQAMYDAADVTVNFGRSGRMGKYLNANWVPFLNPGIQGFDKIVRTVTETKGLAPWLKLTAKAALFGILPKIINELIYRDNDEWKDIKDRDKSIYYLFKLKGGMWLKLPKGRTFAAMSLTEAVVENLIKGEEVSFLDYLRDVGTQIAPANPLENNIVAPLVTTDLTDPKSPGKTWYGGDIESQRLQGYAPGQRFDERTDVVSKWLGGTLGLSPKKINYLLDQYSGVVGDMLLPLLTPQAERDPFSAAFTLDSVSSNKLIGEFYDTLDELEYAKNDPDSDGSDAAVYRYWNKQNTLVSEVNKAIRDIESDPDLKDSEKKELVKAQKVIRNEIERNALDKLEEYQAAATKYYYQADTGDEDDDIRYTYRMANKKVFGAEYALSVYNSNVYEKAKTLRSEDISYDDFFNVYFEDYKTLSNDDEMMSTEKSVKFISRLITKGYNTEKVTAFAETLKFYSSFPATTAIGRYQSMTNSGMTSEAAERALTAASGLEPEVGEDKVSELQKLRAIADQDISESEKVLAVEAISKSSYTRVKLASDYGVELASYVFFYDTLPKYDADSNGSYRQAEVKAALDANRSLSNTQKAVLFQIKTRAKNGRNNPYSSAVGAQVEGVLKAESETTSGLGQSGTLTLDDLKKKYGLGDYSGQAVQPATQPQSESITLDDLRKKYGLG